MSNISQMSHVPNWTFDVPSCPFSHSRSVSIYCNSILSFPGSLSPTPRPDRQPVLSKCLWNLTTSHHFHGLLLPGTVASQQGASFHSHSLVQSLPSSASRVAHSRFSFHWGHGPQSLTISLISSVTLLCSPSWSSMDLLAVPRTHQASSSLECFPHGLTLLWCSLSPWCCPKWGRGHMLIHLTISWGRRHSHLTFWKTEKLRHGD